MSALKTLQEFRSAKNAAHEQVIELVMAVQRCRTELTNIGAVHKLLGDREALACIVQALPPTFRDKWYDKEVPSDTVKKGECLIEWLERQRENTIRIRLDTMASKMRAPSIAPPKSSSAASGNESTDKGLYSSTLHTQTGAKPKVQGEQPPAGARIDVASSADAQAVADRRKVSLESRKLDKCPVCGGRHTYERTWTNVQPPGKAKLISTHLTTCPQFQAMKPDTRLAAVLANAGCPQCAAWDHTEHKYAGGRTVKEPKCSVVENGITCRGAHRRWYQEGASSGSTNSVVAAASAQGPGLYEVYQVPVLAAAGIRLPSQHGDDRSWVRYQFHNPRFGKKAGNSRSAVPVPFEGGGSGGKTDPDSQILRGD